MKTREIEANVKVLDEAGNVVSVITAKGNYSEPENWTEVENMMAEFGETETVRIFNYGLNTIKQAELRSQNNFGPIVKKLVEAGIFKTFREAFEHLISLKNSRK